MWEAIKMYSSFLEKDTWWVVNGVNYQGPFSYLAEAQERADELNEGE